MPLGEQLDRALQILEQLPELVLTTQRTDTALGAAIHAGELLLGPTGGRLLLVQHVLPTQGGAGNKLAQRDDVRLYGTDKERGLLAPAAPDWEALAKSLAEKQICCSTFHVSSGSFS